MIQRILLGVVVVTLFLLTSVIFLAARAPRTWAATWTSPSTMVRTGGPHEYGASPTSTGKWDLLWVDDEAQRLVFSRAVTSGEQPEHIVVDRGDVQDPTLARSGGRLVGAWVKNYNGGGVLKVEILEPGRLRQEVTFARGSAPIEHPFLSAGANGRVNLVFSWQHPDNFDTYLTTLSPGKDRWSVPRRLTHAQFYSFYPRTITDARGQLSMVHLESCCDQNVWNVLYDRYSADGRHLGPSHVLGRITLFSGDRPIPSQWPEDLRLDDHGNIWGVFASDKGLTVFKANPEGHLLVAPHNLITMSPLPTSASIVPSRDGGYLFWDQAHDLGTFTSDQHFNAGGNAEGNSERLAYGGGSEVNPHGAMVNGKLEVVWQTLTAGLGGSFERVVHREAVRPSLAQRLGLGLGNPWQELVILLVGSVGLAALATTGNILTVIVVTGLGLVALRLMGRFSRRWTVFTAYLTLALYVTFVAPGLPDIFLTTLPSMGLAALPFGLIAVAGALIFVSLVGTVALRRIDDIYRAGIMVFLGVYFFAFAEAAVFIQQRLGYI